MLLIFRSLCQTHLHFKMLMKMHRPILKNAFGLFRSRPRRCLNLHTQQGERQLVRFTPAVGPPGTTTRFQRSGSHGGGSRQTVRGLGSTASDSLYQSTFDKALDNASEFWAEQAEQIVWFKRWDKVLDDSDLLFPKWFVGGELNTCYNAVDHHVIEGNGDCVALIHDSPVTNSQEKVTFSQLQEQTAKLARVLIDNGVQKGDRVVIYMPMIPEAVVAMLATARVGAIHSLVFGGFASKELAVRFDHAKPKLVLCASVGLEPGRIVDYKKMLDAAIDMSEHKPHKCVIYNRPNQENPMLIPERDLNWNDVVPAAKPHDCVPVSANDPLYLLYTSGTTGMPKAVVRPSGGHAVALKWTMKNIYGLNPGEVWWAASDLGWVVGHSYICYAPLLNGNTTVVYEGKPVGTPDPGSFFRVLQDHNVAAMFTSPTALRAIIKEDSKGAYAYNYNLEKFRYLFVAGEHLDLECFHWCKQHFQAPVLDNWWQTETSWAITAHHVGLGNNLSPPHGSTGKPVPGWNVKILGSDGEVLKPDELGTIAVKLPLPPGAFSTLWEADDRFKDLYFKKFPGYYNTMDAGSYDSDGYVYVKSRADDVINVAGHRIASSAIEEAIMLQGDVVECAAIGLKDALKGHVPVGLCILKKDVDKTDKQIISEIVSTVREAIGPVAAFKKAVIVNKLPKTRAGKISRQTVASMANGEPFKIPATTEDFTAYDMVKAALQAEGIMKC
ncbi:acyl-CoA synthetase short-chain family member 3, mitochondrial-like [Anneissia japonica]|uniref:acyl-CoA synthetase short-chain family member 3, mitochondrial-like n=1 Tax=Anneissia japonica TaxID=1529436 RepID=UPI0014257845|nr:acyl-CoA synthetase short-chain family member 3, mitochondrial-like [Anneissia japonica]